MRCIHIQAAYAGFVAVPGGGLVRGVVTFAGEGEFGAEESEEEGEEGEGGSETHGGWRMSLW